MHLVDLLVHSYSWSAFCTDVLSSWLKLERLIFPESRNWKFERCDFFKPIIGYGGLTLPAQRRLRAFCVQEMMM
jgi:hypothetical protein